MPETEQLIDVAGRATFIIAMRRRYPSFWRSLNDLWRGRDTSQFERWCVAHQVLDQWLRDACLETLAGWELEPAGPNASLAEGFPWCRYSQPDFQTPDFAPTFNEPYPKYTSAVGYGDTLVQAIYSTPDERATDLVQSVDIESLEDFTNRMKSQFERQLRAYVRTIRSSFDYGARAENYRDGEWTALVFAGCPISRIIAEVDRSSDGRAIDESTIRKAVNRFANRIGLTLP